MEKEEPKISWAKSKARALLYNDITCGNVPLNQKEDGRRMKLIDIYNLRPEFQEYSYKKFSSRVSSLRRTIRNAYDRASWDQEAFTNFVSNHQPAFFSHKGYIQWQGSDAQRCLKEDLEAGLHESMEKKELYKSRPEYYENFPLSQFRDKLSQETKTAKYLNYLKQKDNNGYYS